MTDKELIKAEIESRIQECKDSKIDSSYYDGLISAFEEVRDFIDSIPEEPVSEKLEKAAIEICSKVLEGETILIDGYEYVVLSDAEECFKAGANWQRTKSTIPVSEDLEEAMQHNAPDNIGIDDLLYWRNGFKAGAKWQKEQMMSRAVKWLTVYQGKRYDYLTPESIKEFKKAMSV